MDNVLEVFNLQSFGVKSVNILACGKMSAGNRHSSQPKIYPNHSLTFVTKGRGRYCCNEKSYEIGEGEGFLIPEGKIVSYCSNPEDPWEYVFVILNGAECNILFEQMHISGNDPCFNYPMDDLMIEYINNMLASSVDDHTGGYSVTAFFYLVISRLIGLDGNLTINSRYIDEAVSYIENNYHNNLTVSDIAKFVHIDRSYLYRLFMDKYKLSPKKFVEEYKLRKAVELLEQTNVSICDIASSTGYYDRAHFDRAFLSKFGITPSAWRRQHQPILSDSTIS